LRGWQHAQLFPVDPDEPDRTDPDLIIDALLITVNLRMTVDARDTFSSFTVKDPLPNNWRPGLEKTYFPACLVQPRGRSPGRN
jgi:hypothetical protein